MTTRCAGFIWAIALAVSACTGSARRVHEPAADQRWRHEGAATPSDATRWLKRELLLPGGDPVQASRARAALDSSRAMSLEAHVLRGLDAAFHGRLVSAPGHFLRAAEVARRVGGPDAALLGEFSIQQALFYSVDDEALWNEWGPWVLGALEAPGGLGVGARDRLVSFALRARQRSGEGDIANFVAHQLGCGPYARFAGPFGGGHSAELGRSFAPETLDVWPRLFDRDPLSAERADTRRAEVHGCRLFAPGTKPGVYYVDAMFRLEQARSVVLEVQNAARVWVDGRLVLDRSPSRWATGLDTLAGLRLESGVHRVVARLPSAETRLRVLATDGKAASVTWLSEWEHTLPVLAPPGQVQANPLARYVTEQDVHPPRDPLKAVAAALLSLERDETEVAALLLEPLVKAPREAAGPALELAARVAAQDPLFDDSQRRDLARELYQLAIARDPHLWASETQVAAANTASEGLVAMAERLVSLAERYPEVPGFLEELARVYGELGWRVEQEAVLLQRARRFPASPGALLDAAEALSARGQSGGAESFRERALAIDPDNGIVLQRALAAEDFGVAKRELERLRLSRPDDDALREQAFRLAVTQSRRPSDVKDVWLKRLELEPRDTDTVLALYDLHLAEGDPEGAEGVWAEAVLAGADTRNLQTAQEVREGVSPLAQYRLNGFDVIRQWEASGRRIGGIAARILDYMAVRVRDDGSSELLEHEIVRLETEESIARFAELELRGEYLNMRVIKPDGRTFEPEHVAEKPTVTFPHLAVGDYIETESVLTTAPTGGAAYEGPRWMFREPDVAYARSEFVLLTPAHKPLEIEVTGSVVEPVVTNEGYYVARRWRMDDTPAAASEPFSVPLVESLPSVQASWGLTLRRRLHALGSSVRPLVPVDPRLRRIAKAIVAGLPRDGAKQRARKLFEWVVDNVQAGDELDGRKVVIGKHGNRFRAFKALADAVGVPVRWAVGRNRLAREPTTPGARAMAYSSTVFRVGESDPDWIVIDDVPYGYLPPGLRGAEAYVLDSGETQAVRLPEAAHADAIEYELSGVLGADGSLSYDLEQTYTGLYAAGLRQALREVPPKRLREVIEAKLAGVTGARVSRHSLLGVDTPRRPVRVRISAESGVFARVANRELYLELPFTFRVSQLARTSERTTAMLLVPGREERTIARLTLPEGFSARVEPPRSVELGRYRVAVSDRLEGGQLILDRALTLPASRIAASDYPAFADFVRRAAALLEAPVVVSPATAASEP